jgi:TonB family protein
MKKYLIVTVAGLLISITLIGQEEKILPVAQEMPTLQGCEHLKDVIERRSCMDEKIEVGLAEYLEYPDAAKQAGVDGFVIVRFVVDEKGKPINHTVDEDPGFGMAEAAIKAVKKLGKWVPGRNKGVPVKVRMTIPVKFVMPQAPAEKSVVITPEVHEFAEQMPRFQGCDKADDAEARRCTFESLATYIRQNLLYPEEAKKQNISGTVVVRFIIDEGGAVTGAEVEKSLGAGCDEEALRIVKAMPQWVPGKQGGKPVKVRQSLPFHFKPTEKEQLAVHSLAVHSRSIVHSPRSAVHKSTVGSPQV